VLSGATVNDFHPIVRDWFEAALGVPTAPQRDGWPAIRAGRDTLIAAPTGSGKTLAAFLIGVDTLVRSAVGGDLPDETRILYVSPLKALGNDIQKNLDGPLAAIRALAEARGEPLPPIRTAVRTGDTKGSERARIGRQPPHLLITTPESLYLMLTSESGRRTLGTVRTVIVDEIHAVVGDKRGQHLALSLARLERLVGQRGLPRPQRIGLSATQRPIEAVARFLVGTARAEPLDCAIVDGGHRRVMDVAIELPREELSAVASKEMWGDIADRVAALVREHCTTLVFVDTRRLAERVAHALSVRLGDDKVATHHGALSRVTRLSAEQRLKNGVVPVCVATASLELGIDVGTVDLVVVIGAPRSFAVGLQRIGRSGHCLGATPKARLFPTSRDELVELAAFVRGVRAGALERTTIPTNARDVLAQQIVAAAACEDLGEDELFELVRAAWPYAALARADFDAVLAMLSDGVATRRGRSGAHLHHDGVNHRVRGRRGARLAALTSGGAIPDNADYQVIADPDEAHVGTLNEDFAIESMAGDVFLLGNTSWRIRRVENGRVRVEDAQGMPPSIPFWLGEAPGRSDELSAAVSDYRGAIEPRLDDVEAAARWAVDEGLPAEGARQLVAYLRAGRDALGVLPRQDLLVAERFFDESGGMQLVIHAPFGQKRNRALGLALRKRFCRSFDFELQAAASDDGVLLSLGPQHSFPLESVFDLVHPAEARELLTQAALQAPMFQVRWRWNVTRALAVLRHSGGRRTPPPLLRMRCDDLLSAVFPAQQACQDNAGGGPIEVPDHPLCAETIHDCLTEAMDVDGVITVLESILERRVQLIARDLPEPSVLCHELVNGKPYMFLDDAPLEERRARAVSLRRTLPSGDGGAMAALDADAIATVRAQVWPDPRDADEVHDALLSLIAVPVDVARPWAAWLGMLHATGRARIVPVGAAEAWVATERLGIATDGDLRADAIVRGWMPVVGPITEAELATRTGLGRRDVEAALAGMELDGRILRGAFTAGARGGEEWCDRELLARIHRLTLGRLRREIAPVTPADFVRFLGRWQHVASRLHGALGLAEVIGQLQGVHAPIGAWEADILPSRLSGYQPAWLDALCAAGTVTWGRLAPPDADEPRRGPTRAASIALVLRADLPWLLGSAPDDVLSPVAEQLVELLGRRGAAFSVDLQRWSALPRAAVEQGLGELVAGGRVTCDGFAGVRALANPSIGGGLAPVGRWSLLRSDEPVPADAVERRADQLIRRWGVVFRDVLEREVAAPPWRELTPIYRRLEGQGVLRAGRFVSGFTGEQFALPAAVDALRSVRRTPASGVEILDVAAADPLNVVGILTPGARIPSGQRARVRFVDGVPSEAAVALVG
jgi:ATP-dependent Lhr-like helicase